MIKIDNSLRCLLDILIYLFKMSIEMFISENVSIKNGEIILHVGTTDEEILSNLFSNLNDTLDKINSLAGDIKYHVVATSKSSTSLTEMTSGEKESKYFKNFIDKYAIDCTVKTNDASIGSIIPELTPLSETNALNIMIESGTQGSNTNLHSAPMSCDFDEDEKAYFIPQQVNEESIPNSTLNHNVILDGDTILPHNITFGSFHLDNDVIESTMEEVD